MAFGFPIPSQERTGARWTSSNPAVAQISASGILHVRATGRFTLHASIKEMTTVRHMVSAIPNRIADDGPTIHVNPHDPVAYSIAGSADTVIQVLARRNAARLPLRATSIRRFNAADPRSFDEIRIDSATNLPSRIISRSGHQLAFDYQRSGSMTVTMTLPDGSAAVTTVPLRSASTPSRTQASGPLGPRRASGSAALAPLAPPRSNLAAFRAPPAHHLKVWSFADGEPDHPPHQLRRRGPSRGGVLDRHLQGIQSRTVV
jgi:hypothetical protein